MTIIVPIEDAQKRLAELCELASRGEDVQLTKDGQPAGRITSAPPEAPLLKGERPLGLYRGQIVIHDNFDDPLDGEEAGAFGCGPS